MDSLRIRNLRSLSDTHNINFKKINVFVGQNSSGKSSFIRAFPLFKQSSQVKTVSDILWYGPFVDFGSFEEALSRTADENLIEFTFKMKARFRRPRFRQSGDSNFVGPVSLPILLQLQLIADQGLSPSPLRTNYNLGIFGHLLSVMLDEKLKIVEFSSGDMDLTNEARAEFAFFRHFGLLPGVFPISEVEDEDKDKDNKPISDGIVEILDKFVHGHKLKKTLIRLSTELQIARPENILLQLQSFNLGAYWSDHVSQWNIETPDFKKIVNLLFARDFYQIFEAAGDHISEVSNKVLYVTPLRATAERYYRSQGLSVAEIDPQGRNLAMFLRNLSESEANSFAEWTAKSMGFEVRAETLQGHVSVVLSDPGKQQRINLADTGFGYSQVLPILAQLWQASLKRGRGFDIPKYFVIEQPELHLHPRMQARLADLFVKLANIDSKGAPRREQMRLIIETHSETIINQLGKAIGRKELSPNDIGVYIFEKTGLEGNTTVRESKFDDDGFLTAWPYGFFDAAE